MTHVLLVGNPNCGKTTLFNALTGDNQRVGNWPGVTVAKKIGEFLVGQEVVTLTDLPGVYSLTCTAEGASQDERITTNALVSLQADLIINVVDACHLERHLYLTSQLLELGLPVIVVLNMMDIANQRGITIDSEALSAELNCVVLPIQAHKKIGITALHKAITTPSKVANPLALALSPNLSEAIKRLTKELLLIKSISPSLASYYAWRLAEGDSSLFDPMVTKQFFNIHPFPQEVDILLADARYQRVHQLVAQVQKKRHDASEYFTARIDRLVLHPYLAIPIFLAMMYVMFFFAINVGGAFQDFFDISSDAIFVQGAGWLLQEIHTPHWLIALLANGVGKGINTTLTFIPVIAAMFFFLALLESSGYMARAAFVVDKAMRAIGLPGKSFVPMIVGFGCNVPAIMAARTLDSERDRLLTILMSPFMSCSARLAIYAVFVAAFFPHGGQNIVFALYLIGILMAVFTGFILRKMVLRGPASPLVLELPAYHKPTLYRLWGETSLRLRHFLWRAGRLIIPVCVILGGLNTLTIGGTLSHDPAHTHSLLSLLGHWLTPIFAPMGVQQDNWPATVGLITGMLAKEVVIGSLNSLYAQLGDLSQAHTTVFNCLALLKEAFWSIPVNLISLGNALINPFSTASIASEELSPSVYGMMVKCFDGQAGAFAYLLFILLYIPCVSTMAAIRQEANSQFMWFSISWSLLVAYVAAVIFYQVATITAHPQQSLAWIVGLMLIVVIFLAVLYYWRLGYGDNHVIANS